jgi:hypothetical protein
VITNFPVTIDDAQRAIHIYGLDKDIIKGKATQGKASIHVPNFVKRQIPASVIQHQ